MPPIRDMIEAHPARPKLAEQITECVVACFECAATCSSCADASLEEPDSRDLTGCIRRDLNCAAICAATGTMISRPGSLKGRMVRSLLTTCATACRECAEECRRH